MSTTNAPQGPQDRAAATGMAAMAAGTDLVPFKFARRALNPGDMLLAVKLVTPRDEVFWRLYAR
jgi:hypothetical protein